MNLFEEWKKDMKFVYIKYNFYIEPKFKILDVRKIKNHQVNSFGFWGTEHNGIMNLWINIEIYSNAVDYKGEHINWEDDRTLLDAFNFDKQRWINEIRKRKLLKLYDIL